MCESMMQSQELPPHYTHESLTAIDMIGALYLAYQNQPTYYAVAINLHRPSADFVILSERGIGVIKI